MPAPLSDYGPCAGPLGFPMTDAAARALDALLKDLPRDGSHDYRRRAVLLGPAQLAPGERADVSWITTESVDRVNEVVLASGMDDTQFARNPLVTLGHDYTVPPVGRSLWRRRAEKDGLVGIQAKTYYPLRPDTWPGADAWPPDTALTLVQSGLLLGKSIGFLPTKVHTPTRAERARPGWADVALVIDTWVLLEYACVYLPMNQDSLVEAVSKSAVALPPGFARALGVRPLAATPLSEIDHCATRAVAALDLGGWLEKNLELAFQRRTGRV